MSKQKKIMIVDDEAGIRKLLLDVLSEEDFKITLAKDGQESIDKMKNHHFDLLITPDYLVNGVKRQQLN